MKEGYDNSIDCYNYGYSDESNVFAVYNSTTIQQKESEVTMKILLFIAFLLLFLLILEL